MFGNHMPDEAAYRQVRCFDLSATGFSFLSTTPLESGKLVIALGSPPDFKRLKAEVVHDTMYRLIGCRFIGRVGG